MRSSIPFAVLFAVYLLPSGVIILTCCARSVDLLKEAICSLTVEKLSPLPRLLLHERDDGGIVVGGGGGGGGGRRQLLCCVVQIGRAHV